MNECKCNKCGNLFWLDTIKTKSYCPHCGTLFLEDTASEASEELNNYSPKFRKWLIGLILVALLAIPIAPIFPLVFGILLFLLCIDSIFPSKFHISGPFLGTTFKTNIASIARITLFSVFSLILMLGGLVATITRADNKGNAIEKKEAKKTQAEEAELEHVIAEENQEVASYVRRATNAWEQGDIELAKYYLKKTEEFHHASNISLVRQLQTNITNHEVEVLMERAIESIRSNHITEAKKLVTDALAFPEVEASVQAKGLQSQLALATEPERIHEALMNLSDEDFIGLQRKKTIPISLASGYDSLDKLILDHALGHIREVAKERTEYKKKLEEEEAARAEAERKKKSELAEAQRKKKIEQQFSKWDGSHRTLTIFIKENMNDASSYEHVKTVFIDKKDYLIVTTSFRGKNAFGATVLNSITAKVDLEGNILEIVST